MSSVGMAQTVNADGLFYAGFVHCVFKNRLRTSDRVGAAGLPFKQKNLGQIGAVVDP